ncbi:hypothetical protein T310_8279, partial [Rasamsonia emersonii CBS 393.64]
KQKQTQYKTRRDETKERLQSQPVMSCRTILPSQKKNIKIEKFYLLHHLYLLPRLRNYPLILPRPNILERPLKMPSGVLQTRVCFPLIRLQVRVDQLDQPVQILGRHRLVLLVKVVHVAVQDLHE